MTSVLRGAAAQSAGQTRLPARTAPPPAVASAPVPAPPVAPPVTAPVPAIERGPSEAELRELRERAREAGFAQGLREAQGQVADAAARQAAAWTAAISALQAEVASRLQHAEDFAVALAFEACARVLGDAALDAVQVAAVVRRLLADTRESGLLRIQLAPAELEVARAALQDDPHWQHRPLAFEADPTLGAGECRVVSTHGQLETSLPVQLDAIRQSLLATFAGRAHERSA